jgi:hypothetical protein
VNIYVCRQINICFNYHTVGTVPNVLLKKWFHLPNILKGFPATYPCFLIMISIYSPIILANIHLIHSSFLFSLISMLTNHLIACYTQLHGLFVKRDDLNYYEKENIVLNLRLYCFFYWKSCFEMTRIKTTTTKSTFLYITHRCQPLWFFRNCYEFRAKITVLRSTVYLLRISDYCRPGTVPHLHIIMII